MECVKERSRPFSAAIQSPCPRLIQGQRKPQTRYPARSPPSPLMIAHGSRNLMIRETAWKSEKERERGPTSHLPYRRDGDILEGGRDRSRWTPRWAAGAVGRCGRAGGLRCARLHDCTTAHEGLSHGGGVPMGGNGVRVLGNRRWTEKGQNERRGGRREDGGREIERGEEDQTRDRARQLVR